MENAHLTQEEIDALKDYAAAYGEEWKSYLSAAWLRGCVDLKYKIHDENVKGILYSLRNSSRFGPAGLRRFQVR